MKPALMWTLVGVGAVAVGAAAYLIAKPATPAAALPVAPTPTTSGDTTTDTSGQTAGNTPGINPETGAIDTGNPDVNNAINQAGNFFNF